MAGQDVGLQRPTYGELWRFAADVAVAKRGTVDDRVVSVLMERANDLTNATALIGESGVELPTAAAPVDVATLDVGQLNDAASVLWGEAYDRGARAGAEKAMVELVTYHGGQMLELATRMLETALGCENGEQWRLAQYAHMLVSRTPGSGRGSYGRVLSLLSCAVPSSGVVDRDLLAEARVAVEVLAEAMRAER